MELIFFPFERVIEINAYILENEPGMKGAMWMGGPGEASSGKVRHAGASSSTLLFQSMFYGPMM